MKILVQRRGNGKDYGIKYEKLRREGEVGVSKMWVMDRDE